MRNSAQDVWIVIAARNEGAVIGDVVRELRKTFRHIVVVDDGSSDETSAAAKLGGATVLRHVVNRGQGAALQSGLDYACAKGAQFMATFDADGQHNPADILHMLAAIERTGADVALGSRFLGRAQGMSWQKRLFLKAALKFQTLTVGLKLTDVHNGLRLFTRDAARRIRIQQDRMAHASEIIAKIARLNLRFVEVPCTIRYTEYSMAKGQRMSGSLQILLDLAMRGMLR